MHEDKSDMKKEILGLNSMEVRSNLRTFYTEAIIWGIKINNQQI